jgi:hypothetical protein
MATRPTNPTPAEVVEKCGHGTPILEQQEKVAAERSPSAYKSVRILATLASLRTPRLDYDLSVFKQ